MSIKFDLLLLFSLQCLNCPILVHSLSSNFLNFTFKDNSFMQQKQIQYISWKKNFYNVAFCDQLPRKLWVFMNAAIQCAGWAKELCGEWVGYFPSSTQQYTERVDHSIRSKYFIFLENNMIKYGLKIITRTFLIYI